MKLIDLLVQELPRLGGWPHGFSHHLNGFLLRNKVVLVIESGQRFFEDWDGEIVNEDQYEAALAASQQPEWSGEGLPPLGCECEWQDRNTKQWNKVSVVYASEWVTVIREDKIADPVELAIENYGDEARRQFRPIRTEAERKRENQVEAISQILSYRDGCSPKPMAGWIIDAIAAGKIPGVKLE